VTWQNSYPAGSSIDEGVRVIRFPVARRRRLKVFADLSDDVFAGPVPADREEAWFRENGPETPDLIDHLRDRGADYDLVLFWSFRYYPTYYGLPLVAERAVLVPTAEEDPAIDLSVLHDFFQRPAGYLFLTPEEESLVSSRAGRALRPSAVVGMGLDPAASTPPAAADLPSNYVLYLGRVDRNKGCETLLAYFEEYAANGGDATLVLAGPSTILTPTHPRIRALGYVADHMRQSLLAHARLLVIPSPYESLSIVLLEAWNMGVPALVNGRCKVLAGQTSRANGGLTYRSAREFGAAIDYLLTNAEARDAMGRQGLEQVEREYRWPTVLARVEQLLMEVRRQLEPVRR
jgi:glycosyltransferase involved in cell wall biosynthesis